MAREVDRLSAKTVEKAKQPGYYHDGAGLYLQVGDAGSKSWIYRYTLAGKTREMGLGSHGAFTLAEARERARTQRKLLADGVDPIAARDAQKTQELLRKANTLTFAQCAEKYIAAHRAGWRNPKHVAQWTNTLRDYAEPVIGKLPVHEVDTARVMRVIEPIWTKKAETAQRVRGRIERILDWARVQKYREGENPARWRGHLDKLLPNPSRVHVVKNLAALPYNRIGAFVRELREQPGTAAKALEFAILTAARTGEVRGAKWPEFDLEAGVWTVPPERMKAKKLHRVPLSPRALEIVKAQSRDGDYVFHSERTPDKPFSDMAMLKVLERMERDEVTVHGFRSTFRDWTAEQTSYPRDVCEMALAHAIESDVEAAYRRGDLLEKRRALMKDWARFCATPSTKGNVVSIKRRTAKATQ